MKPQQLKQQIYTSWVNVNQSNRGKKVVQPRWRPNVIEISSSSTKSRFEIKALETCGRVDASQSNNVADHWTVITRFTSRLGGLWEAHK